MEAQDVTSFFHWKNKASTYESLFLEQKDICAHYRKIVEEQQQQIKDLKSKKSFDKMNCAKEPDMI